MHQSRVRLWYISPAGGIDHFIALGFWAIQFQSAFGVVKFKPEGVFRHWIDRVIEKILNRMVNVITIPVTTKAELFEQRTADQLDQAIVGGIA